MPFRLWSVFDIPGWAVSEDAPVQIA
jgi:hypothetical protein